MLGRLCSTDASPAKPNASSFERRELAAALQCQRKCGGLNTGEDLAEAHVAREQPSKGLTLS